MGSINTCRFHGNAFDFAFCEPLGDRIQITVSPKAPYVLFGAVWRHADPMLTCANVDACCIRVTYLKIFGIFASVTRSWLLWFILNASFIWGLYDQTHTRLPRFSTGFNTISGMSKPTQRIRCGDGG